MHHVCSCYRADEYRYGASNDRSGGCGSIYDINDILSSSSSSSSSSSHRGFVVRKGILASEAIELLKKFYERGNPNAPEYKRARPLMSSLQQQQ